MINDRQDCTYNDFDEDCYKCVKHGYVFSCSGCKDYKPMFGKKDNDEESKQCKG